MTVSSRMVRMWVVLSVEKFVRKLVSFNARARMVLRSVRLGSESDGF